MSEPPATLVDTSVLLDILSHDEKWLPWSSEALEKAADAGPLVINPVIFAEVSIRFSRIEDVEAALPPNQFVRAPLPWPAAFLAGKCYVSYREQGGTKTSPLPDFFIGAHAAVSRLRLLTRGATRYRSYFPTVELLTPA